MSPPTLRVQFLPLQRYDITLCDRFVDDLKAANGGVRGATAHPDHIFEKLHLFSNFVTL